MVETQAVRLAAQRRSQADLDRLRQLNRLYEADMRRNYVAGESNTQFHLAIVETVKNPPLTQVMTTLLVATMEIYGFTTPPRPAECCQFTPVCRRTRPDYHGYSNPGPRLASN